MPKLNTQTPAFRAAELAALLVQHAPWQGFEKPQPHHVARTVAMLQRATVAAKHWAERQCNEPIDDAQQARGDKRIAKMQAECNVALDVLFGGVVPRCTVKLGGDPRGACGRLHIPGQRGDGWGDGFAIY